MPLARELTSAVGATVIDSVTPARRNATVISIVSPPPMRMPAWRTMVNAGETSTVSR